MVLHTLPDIDARSVSFLTENILGSIKILWKDFIRRHKACGTQRLGSTIFLYEKDLRLVF